MKDFIPHYIGVTGVQTAREIETLVSAAAAAGIGPGQAHNLMLGALASPSTVQNQPPTHTSKPYRHVPSREDLVALLQSAQRHNIIGMVHVELHKTWPGTTRDGDAVIELLRYLGAHHLTPAVQLNGVLLPTDIVRIHHETGVRIVIQLRKELEELGESQLLDYLQAVAPAVSTILMDPSAGAGTTIDLAPALRLMRNIDQQLPNTFHFGFAGGLGGSTEAEIKQTSYIIAELSRAIPNGAFSVDVETKVRVPIEQPGIDRLDSALCAGYFSAVIAGRLSR